MTPETNRSTNVADKMKTVKAASDISPSDPKWDAPLKHCQAVEKARTAANDADTHKELDAATHALAWHDSATARQNVSGSRAIKAAPDRTSSPQAQVAQQP